MNLSLEIVITQIALFYSRILLQFLHKQLWRNVFSFLNHGMYVRKIDILFTINIKMLGIWSVIILLEIKFENI